MLFAAFGYYVSRAVHANATRLTEINQLFTIQKETVIDILSSQESKALFTDSYATREKAALSFYEKLQHDVTTLEGVAAPFRVHIENELEAIGKTVGKHIQDISSRDRNIQQLIHAALAISLLLALGISYATAKSISTPLNTLIRAARALRDGELDTPIDIQSHDEMSLLAQTMRHMAGSLGQNLAQLQETTASLSAIIANMADGLLATDAKGKITQCNPALLNLYDLQGVSVLGQDCKDVFAPELVELVNRVHAAPAETFTAEIKLPGNRFSKAVATGIHDAVYRGAIVLLRDITEEKYVDQMKTDFVSTISHEIRTPLTSVLGFAKLIKRRFVEVILPSIRNHDLKTRRAIRQVQENVDIILTEGERLTVLINNVLDIAKVEAGNVEWNMQTIALAEMIERALATAAVLFQQRGLVLIQDIEDDLPDIVGDQDRLIQVVLNLLSNAAKFTDSGSVICRVKRMHDSVTVQIIDTGMGISATDLPKVFEKFRQVEDTLTDKPKGTGLGLAICKQIVEYHGGRIWGESELGQGSTFSFMLPIEQMKAEGQIALHDLDTAAK